MPNNEQQPEETTNRRRLLSRRRFLQVAGIALGGTVAGLYFGRDTLRREAYQFLADLDTTTLPPGIENFAPDYVFELQEDNSLVINVTKAEMGQGVFTGLAMLAAEELDFPLSRIKTMPNSTANGMVDGLGTGGSFSTASLYTPMREVAATFREMLKLAAAAHWSVDVADITTEDAHVISGDMRMQYIEVVNVTSEWIMPDPPELRPESGFTVIGTERPRVDLMPKVMGEPIFAIDAEIPDMVYANVLKCPYIDGTLDSMDESAARGFDGVIDVINEDGLVAIVAENRFAAEMGKRLLNAQWNVPKAWQQAELDEMCTVGTTNSVSLQRIGDVNSQFDNENLTLVEAEYRVADGVHAHMEPHVAIADVTGDSAFIITGTQGASTIRNNVASRLGIPAENVQVQNTYLGGGFGRRVWLSNAEDAARISQIIGKPVQVVNDRETEFLCGFVRPATHHTLRGSVDDNGKLVAIEHNIASGSQSFGITEQQVPEWFPLRAVMGADLVSASHGAPVVYDVENRHSTIWDIPFPYNAGIWRAVGMFPNGFAIESFIDEIAHATNQDPLEFRLNHLHGADSEVARMHELLTTLRQESNWDSPKPEGVGRGVAIIEDRKTIAGVIIEVEVEDGRVRVLSAVNAIDPGIIINPEGIRQQVEGCVMMGISAALYEETQVVDGQFSASNYHEYPMAMLSDTPPEIKVILLANRDKPSGVGEPPLGPIAPALANAIFDATGQRQRRIPLLKGLEL